MTNLFTNLSNWKLKYVCALVVLSILRVGTVLGAAPTLSDLSFSTESSVRIVNENFNGLSTTDKTAKMAADASLSGFGVFNKGYNNSTSNHYEIESSTFSSNALKITMGSGSPCGVAISGKTFGTKGAYRIKVTKAAKMYAGIYAEGATSAAYAKANASVYIQANEGDISISKNTKSGNWQSVGSYTSNTYIDICVIYNNTATSATYGNSITLAATSAHVYIDGTCVMNGENPKSFTISGLTLSTFRVYPIASDGNVASVDDIQIWNALPGAAVTCSNDPTVGAASIKGTFNGGGVTSLTNISDVFSAASSAAGSATCSITEYGFVWSDGSTNTNPVIDGSGVTKEDHSGAPSGDGGSFSSNMVGTWVVDHTYYYKAYVKNGRPATAYSTAASFTVRGITFDSNDGSSVSTKYIKSGGVMTAPTAPTKDGNVFAGWYSNEELTSAVDWSSAVTSSTTYYAKWYSVTVNVEDEAGNTLSGSGKPTASCTGTTLSTSAGSEKYVFKEWQVSNTASLGSDATTASNSLTSITGNVTVTAVYHAPIALTKGTNTGAGTFNFSSNPIGYGETLTITCAADASHKGSPTVTASGTHGTITTVSATSVTIANVQSAMTVNISYAAKEAAVVKLHVAGNTSTISGTRYEGDSYDLPEDATECPDMGLYGWYEESYSDEDDAPTGSKFHSKRASVTLDAGDNDFYAVYATMNAHSSVYFEEITSESSLTSGDYLIGGLTSPYCMKTSKGDTYMNEIGMSSYNDDGVINYNSNSDIIWVITRDGSNVTIKGNNNSKYLAINSGVIGVQDGSYSFTFDYGTTKTDSWTFTSVTEPTQQLIYSGYSGFCAGTTQSSDISIYKRQVISSGPYTTSPSCTTHTLDVEVTPDGKGTATAGKTVLGEDKTTTVSASPIANYSFAYWTISGTGSTMSNTSDGKSTDNPVTVTMGTEDATITAHFTENPYHYATFKNDLTAVSGYDHVKVYDGTKPTPPTMTDVTDACDKSECTLFYGWIAEAGIWDDTKDDISDKTIYRSASSLPEVDGADVTYHAVWAKGSAAPTINSTLVAKWDQQSLSASTAVKAKDKDGNTLNDVTLTSNVALSTSGKYTYYASSLSSYPTITISGLNFSSYDGGILTFFARASGGNALTIEYSTDDGDSFDDLEWTDNAIGTEYSYIVELDKATTDVKINYASNSGTFFFGTVRVYGATSTTYTFDELTSSNTSGWSGDDWDGYYLIVGNTKSKALRSDVMEGIYGITSVSPSEGQISTDDLGLIYKVTYNSSTSKYAIQCAATLDYMTDNSGGWGSTAYYLLETSATEANAIAYNEITHTTDKYIRWYSPGGGSKDRFGSYGSSTGDRPTLYKILSSYSKWRISCCEKNDISKGGTPAGTVTGGTFTVDKTSACEGATVTMSVTSTSSGYNFDEWEVTGDDSSDEITVTDNTFEMPDEAVTVTAKFKTAHTTTVTLNAQGGSSGTSSVTATVNLAMPDATMPTKTGYDFGGYYLATNGSGTQYYDADGNSAHDWDNGEDDTEVLYAKWTAKGYTVTLNKEDATTQGTSSVSVTYGANTNLTSAITCPTYSGKVFGGYWTTASGEGTQLIDVDGNWIPNVTNYTGGNKQWLYANNIELHARWSNVSYTNYRTTCGPEIEVTVSGTVRLTAYAGCEVLSPSTALITVHSDDWKSKADALTFLHFRFKDKVSGVTYSHTSSNITSSEFRVYHASGNGGSYADNGYISIPAGTTDSTFSFRVAYTPRSGSYNTTDHYLLEVEAMDNSATKKTITLELLDLYGRTLPQEFVVAVKKDGNWYALPNNLPSTSTAAKATAAIPIVVDNTTTPTCATFAPENVLYKATGYYTAPAVASRNRSGVRFTRNGSQYLQVSTTAGTNTMWLSTTGGADVQDWYLNSSNFQSYELKMDPRAGSGGYKDKKMGMKGSNFGFYSSPDAYDIYLLPVETVLEEASVVEWGTNSLIMEVDAGGYYHVIARVGDEATGALSYSQTLTSVVGYSSTKTYTINVGDAINFDEEADNLLYLDWLNSSGGVAAVSMVPIPWLIKGTKTMSVVDDNKDHWANAEVHVLPDAVLTADAGTFSGVTIKQLEIYPGATVNVTTGTLTTKNLMLRNGWKRIGEKAYDAARLYITPTNGNLKATNVFADWYIDYDQYYPIAVPWKVATAGITYLNTSNAASGGVKLRHYDGDRRANGGSGDTNWKQYTWGYDMPEYLVPGIGYAMTAKRASGRAFSIVRMPLTLPAGSWTNGDWTTAGEAGNVEITEVTYHKDTVHVDAWGADKNRPLHSVGWNFIANPYMSLYQGDITHSETGGGKDYDINFVSIPDIQFREFEQYPVGAAGQKLLPAGGFFIQTEKTGYLTFGTGNRKASTPSYRNELQNLTTKQKAYIILNDEENEDMMGLLVSNHYTVDYDINGDLEKLMGDGTSLKTYMHYGDLNMAYVAINEELAREWIPVSVRIPENGEYTYSLHDASIAGELEGIYLIDYENGDVITNLMDNDYTFYSPAGTISGRFAINAIVGKHDTPTSIDIINAGGDIHSDKPVKFIWNDKVFILHRGVIYDSTGKKVREINK